MSRRRRLERQRAALQAQAKRKRGLKWVSGAFVGLAILTPVLAWTLLPDRALFPAVVLIAWLLLPFLWAFTFETVKGLQAGEPVWRAATRIFRGWRRATGSRGLLISSETSAGGNEPGREPRSSDFAGGGGRSGGAGASGKW